MTLTRDDLPFLAFLLVTLTLLAAMAVGQTRVNRVDGIVVYVPQAVTCADTGDANPCTVTITPTARYVEVTCNDANTCDVTMGESGAVEGAMVTLVNVSTNTVDFPDTAGVSEIAGAFAAGQHDAITLGYNGNTWFQISRSDN